MDLSPTERAAVMEMVADRIHKTMMSMQDPSELTVWPASVVSQITGLSRSQVSRTFKLRPIGKRKSGVSLKELQEYTNQ